MTEDHGDEIVEDLHELGYSDRDIADLNAMNERENRDIARGVLLPTYAETEGAVGSRETWVVGETETADGRKVTFRLDSGAGLGHTHLALRVDVDGERAAWEFIDVGELAEGWARAIVTEGDVVDPDAAA